MRRLNPYDELFLIGNELKEIADTDVLLIGASNYQRLLKRLMDATDEVCTFLTNCSVEDADLYRRTSMQVCASEEAKRIWETMRWSSFNHEDAQYPFGAMAYLSLCYDVDDFSDIYSHRMKLTKIAERYRTEFLESCLDAVSSGVSDDKVVKFLETNGDIQQEDISFMLEARESKCLFYNGW